METDTFNFTDTEFLDIVNMILKSDTPMGDEFIPITNREVCALFKSKKSP
tara:strand:- start:1 stop:150 length:150 start_codon:yes stop_codon:yes gene_type:complete